MQTPTSYSPAANGRDASSEIARQMLSAVRRAAPGQFGSPEAGVRFLIQQVAANDVDEASRVFPIFETFDQADLASSARAFNIVSPSNNPMPGAPFQRAMLALRSLSAFDALRLRLAGIDPSATLQVQGSPGNTPDAIAARLAKADSLPVEIVSLVEKRRETPRGATPIPYTSVAIMQAEVRRGDVMTKLEIVTLLIGDNWKVVRVEQTSL